MTSYGDLLFWRIKIKPGRPFAFGKGGILLDGKIIVKDRILKAKKTENGANISIEWYGWLMEKKLPDCEVTDAILEEFSD